MFECYPFSGIVQPVLPLVALVEKGVLLRSCLGVDSGWGLGITLTFEC